MPDFAFFITFEPKMVEIYLHFIRFFKIFYLSESDTKGKGLGSSVLLGSKVKQVSTRCPHLSAKCPPI